MTVSKCVINYFKKHIHIFFITIITIILVTFISLLPPQLLKIIVDNLMNKNEDYLNIYALFYVLIYFSMGIINFFKEILLIIISQGVGKNVRLEMLKKINKMSYINFSKYDNGKLETFFSNDVDAINTLITSGAISMFIDSFKIIGIIISIFIVSYIFGLITLLIIPLIILFTLWIRKRMYSAQLDNRKLEGSINSLVLENIDNIATIKSFRILDKIKNKYNKVLNNHFKTNQKVNTYDSIFSPIMQIMKTAIIVFIICCSSINVSLFNMSIGMLVSSIDLITNLFSPIENIGMELQTIQNSFAALDRINAFFKLKEDDEKLQIKMLNTGKGPGVQCLRAQEDKLDYPKIMQEYAFHTENLTLLEGMVNDILHDENKVFGVKVDNKDLTSKAVVLTTGTYMEARVLVGHQAYDKGPDGEKSTHGLSPKLQEMGIKILRLKTGTPQRIKSSSIDYDKLIPQYGMEGNLCFSYDNKENVIGHFNLELKNDQRIVLKGKSGSGKSTIFKLAYGLIKPTSGRVTINGIDTYFLPNEIKNKYFGIVYQDYFFSNGTIKDEITLLNNNISDEEIYKALNLVGLTRIKDINKKLEINDYSTGELSLFNIARVIVLDCKILFLDEMNAKIDNANAKNIINVIDKISKDKIVLSINHYGYLLDNSKIINLEK